MAFEPSNITLIEIEWVPTNEIRFSGKRKKTAELQQRWFNASTKASEWRDVPFVHQEA